MSKQKARMGLMQQYLLTGGGLGLYFGLFFRPTREPSFAFAVALALLAVVVLTILALFKKDRPSLAELGQTAVTNFIKFALVLALLESRHYAYDWGGKWLVSLFTTGMGVIAGWWLAQQQMKQARSSR